MIIPLTAVGTSSSPLIAIARLTYTYIVYHDTGIICRYTWVYLPIFAYARVLAALLYQPALALDGDAFSLCDPACDALQCADQWALGVRLRDDDPRRRLTLCRIPQPLGSSRVALRDRLTFLRQDHCQLPM